MTTELNKCINLLINRYYTNEKTEELRKQIIEKIRELVYFMPKERMYLNEEDCAEILLKLDSRIPAIFEKYESSYGDFAVYLYPQLEKIVNGYRKEYLQNYYREKALLLTQSAYEYQLGEQDNSMDSLYASEVRTKYTVENNLVIQRLKSVFFLHPTTRIRFYVYFLAYSVLMDDGTIRKICSLFNYNFGQTVRLMRYCQNNIPTSGREELSHAREKRDEYFGRQIYLESELAILNFLADHSKDEVIYDQLDRIKDFRNSKTTFIRSQKKRIPRSVLAPLLHTSDGTIACYMSRSCHLLEWCLNPEDFGPNINLQTTMGISGKTASLICQKKSLIKLSKNKYKELKPIETFHINIPLNC